MIMQLKYISRWTTRTLGIIILLALLVACGTTSGGSTSTATPTSAPPTLLPTTTMVAMATLAGNGYTMSYPQSWQISRSGTLLVTLADSTGTTKMTITVAPDPNGAISADTLVDTALKAAMVPLKNTQSESVSPTVTVAGNSWSQKSVSGTTRLNSANTDIQAVVIANVHPGNTPMSKSYTIVYSAPKTMFNQANAAYFQPILQSFKFLS